jgi:hypothetical protein
MFEIFHQFECCLVCSALSTLKKGRRNHFFCRARRVPFFLLLTRRIVVGFVYVRIFYLASYRQYGTLDVAVSRDDVAFRAGHRNTDVA